MNARYPTSSTGRVGRYGHTNILAVVMGAVVVVAGIVVGAAWAASRDSDEHTSVRAPEFNFDRIQPQAPAAVGAGTILTFDEIVAEHEAALNGAGISSDDLSQAVAGPVTVESATDGAAQHEALIDGAGLNQFDLPPLTGERKPGRGQVFSD